MAFGWRDSGHGATVPSTVDAVPDQSDTEIAPADTAPLVADAPRTTHKLGDTAPLVADAPRTTHKLGDTDGDGTRDFLILDDFGDRLNAFRSLSKTNDEAGIDAVLQNFGAKGKVETDIVRELAARRPLYLPSRFEEAHRMAMRALEVLDRNGARAPKLPKLGPLTPILAWLVQLISRFIVRNHQAEAITAIKNLYVRREANCPKDSPERFMLRRARIDAERVLPTLKKNPLGVPTFLLGGAVVSWISSLLSSALEGAKSKVGLIIVIVALFVLFALISWSALRGAAVARHRIHLSLDDPLKALWETVGAAGKPPKDSSASFALIAIILSGLALVLIPIILVVVVVR
jgi:hypothetical protein